MTDGQLTHGMVAGNASGLYWLQFKRSDLMTYGIAVQPTAWSNFDQWGCMWAENMEHAYKIAKVWGEPCMIWHVPATGNAIRWCRATEITDAIADLVFGA